MLALTRFEKDGRPKFSDLPKNMKEDIKSFFGSYSKCVELSDKLLFSVGNSEYISKAISQSKIGKKLPDSIYIHNSAIPYLEDVLQVFIGCGKAIVGEIEGDVIVKIPKKANSISFLIYNDFDHNPHPELLFSIRVNLHTAKISTRNYSESDNPPILHRKELFVAQDYPFYSYFKKFTEMEESLGLLGRNDIGFKKNWYELTSTVPEYNVKWSEH